MARKVLLLMLVALSVAATAAAAAKTGPRKKSHKAKAPVVQPAPEPVPVPAPPPPQLTPEQGPSSPPEVSFQGGQLTIVARNSTMGDVLTAVKQRTGAAVDMPAVSSERVVGRFGPGAPRDVMAQLLNGSHYDYVLVGSPAEPGSLKKVVLMARVNGPQSATQQSNQPTMQGNQNLQAVPDIASDDQSDQNSNAEVPEAPEAVEQEEPQPDQQQQQPGPNGPVVKTPEQLLRELQQQQQQQQQNGAPPGAPPQ